MFKKISLLILLAALPITALAQSINEIVQEGSSSVQEINSVSVGVDSLLQQAQGSGDSILLQCISTKQASISALRDISEVAMSSLEGTSDLDKASYELRKITLSLSKVRQFGNEASQCSAGASGSDNSEDGEDSSEITVDKSGVESIIVEGDSIDGGTNYSFDSTSTTTDTEVDGGITIDTPPETSPY